MTGRFPMTMALAAAIAMIVFFMMGSAFVRRTFRAAGLRDQSRAGWRTRLAMNRCSLVDIPTSRASGLKTPLRAFL